MSEEEQELLARIGRLAGQINRHRNQQGSTHAPQTAHHRQPAYHRPAPYPTRGYRTARGHRGHRHRSLQVNHGASTEASASDTSSGTPGWVAKNDRHRQLINVNVYERDTQNRAKAIEETRQKKAAERRLREKARMQMLMQDKGTGPAAAPARGSVATRNELTIQGLNFRVMDGGKKLSRISDDSTMSQQTPKTAIVAGVKFHRTKTGNLVINRVVQDYRRSGIKKLDEPCRTFSATGSCSKGPSCRYIHDPNKVALCRSMLKDGKCALGDACDLSHETSPERVPDCLHFAKGNCTKVNCAFTHSKAPPGAPVCREFGFRGYCDKGADCTERHVFECPDFSNTGKCNNKGCKLLHRERASVLRIQTSDGEMDDVSSEDEAQDSDDVDSDAVADLVEADSDESDFEPSRGYIAL